MPGEETNVAWVRGLWEAMRSFARGTYVNHLGVDASAKRVKDAYSPEKYVRLAALKRTFEPDNVYHRNQNTRPRLHGLN